MLTVFSEIISIKNCHELMENKSVASKFGIKLYTMLFLLTAISDPTIA